MEQTTYLIVASSYSETLQHVESIQIKHENVSVFMVSEEKHPQHFLINHRSPTRTCVFVKQTTGPGPL